MTNIIPQPNKEEVEAVSQAMSDPRNKLKLWQSVKQAFLDFTSWKKFKEQEVIIKEQDEDKISDIRQKISKLN